MGPGGNILFSSAKVMLDVGILFNTFPEIHYFLHMPHAGNESCWVSSIYLKGTVAYERGTYTTVLRKASQTSSGKATLVCCSALDSLPWTGTHPLSSAAHSELHSAHALPPGKRGGSIYVQTLKKPNKVEHGGGWVCTPPSTESTCACEANPGRVEEWWGKNKTKKTKPLSTHPFLPEIKLYRKDTKRKRRKAYLEIKFKVCSSCTLLPRQFSVCWASSTIFISNTCTERAQEYHLLED